MGNFAFDWSNAFNMKDLMKTNPQKNEIQNLMRIIIIIITIKISNDQRSRSRQFVNSSGFRRKLYFFLLIRYINHVSDETLIRVLTLTSPYTRNNRSSSFLTTAAIGRMERWPSYLNISLSSTSERSASSTTPGL